MPPPSPSPSPTSYESHHVHTVYAQIAPHFSSTRHKPWPIVSSFLHALPPGSIGLDVGCGNGKYLAVNSDVFIVASDRSRALVDIARGHQPHEAFVADGLDLPHPRGVFDFAISIAVVHHLSTEGRRVEGIRAILQTLRRPSSSASGGASAGEALIFVWALEQKNSRRGWDRGDEQDVLVPWVMKFGEDGSEEKTYQRYYHLFEEGELERLIMAAGGAVMRKGYDRDNWWAVAVPVE